MTERRRSVLAVSMLRESVALGVLTLTRSEVRLPAGHHTGAAGQLDLFVCLCRIRLMSCSPHECSKEARSDTTWTRCAAISKRSSSYGKRCGDRQKLCCCLLALKVPVLEHLLVDINCVSRKYQPCLSRVKNSAAAPTRATGRSDARTPSHVN